MHDRNYYIFNQPVASPFGIVRFLKYPEYVMNAQAINMISHNVLHFYYLFSKDMKTKDAETIKELESLKERKLREIVLTFDIVLQSYVDIFRLVLDKNDFVDDHDEFMEVTKEIFSTDENFELMRSLLMEMNQMQEEEVSANPEIQQFIENDKLVKRTKNKDAPSYMDIVTSIVANGSATYNEINEMTPLQVNALFSRIGAIMNYQATTLFRTVSNDIDIESWSKKIDMFDVKNTSTLSKSEFDNKFGKMLG